MAHPPRALPTVPPDRPADSPTSCWWPKTRAHARIDRDFLKKARVVRPRVVFPPGAAQAALVRLVRGPDHLRRPPADTDGLAFAAWLKWQPG
jgi:hypothetical protein